MFWVWKSHQRPSLEVVKQAEHPQLFKDQSLTQCALSCPVEIRASHGPAVMLFWLVSDSTAVPALGCQAKAGGRGGGTQTQG